MPQWPLVGGAARCIVLPVAIGPSRPSLLKPRISTVNLDPDQNFQIILSKLSTSSDPSSDSNISLVSLNSDRNVALSSQSYLAAMSSNTNTNPMITPNASNVSTTPNAPTVWQPLLANNAANVPNPLFNGDPGRMYYGPASPPTLGSSPYLYRPFEMGMTPGVAEFIYRMTPGPNGLTEDQVFAAHRAHLHAASMRLLSAQMAPQIPPHSQSRPTVRHPWPPRDSEGRILDISPLRVERWDSPTPHPRYPVRITRPVAPVEAPVDSEASRRTAPDEEQSEEGESVEVTPATDLPQRVPVEFLDDDESSEEKEVDVEFVDDNESTEEEEVDVDDISEHAYASIVNTCGKILFDSLDTLEGDLLDRFCRVSGGGEEGDRCGICLESLRKVVMQVAEETEGTEETTETLDTFQESVVIDQFLEVDTSAPPPPPPPSPPPVSAPHLYYFADRSRGLDLDSEEEAELESDASSNFHRIAYIDEKIIEEKGNAVVMPCAHAFHTTCIVDAFTYIYTGNACPVCRFRPVKLVNHPPDSLDSHAGRQMQAENGSFHRLPPLPVPASREALPLKDGLKAWIERREAAMGISNENDNIA